MTTTDDQTYYDTLKTLQTDVISILRMNGYNAEFHHSGGGIVVVAVTTEVGNRITTTLEDDGSDWLTLDLDSPDDFITSITLEVRPYGGNYEWTPADIASGLMNLLKVIR